MSSSSEEDDATNTPNSLQDVTPEQLHTFASCFKLILTTVVDVAMDAIMQQMTHSLDARAGGNIAPQSMHVSSGPNRLENFPAHSASAKNSLDGIRDPMGSNGDKRHDWTKEFYANGSFEAKTGKRKQSDGDETPSVAEKLRKLSQDIKKGKPTKVSKSKEASPREGRVPIGFSLRMADQKRGQKPICRGCKVVIQYTDKCICHKHRAKAGHKHDTIEQYHCRAACLQTMPKHHLAEFLRKKWVLSVAKDVVEEISK